MSRIKDDIRRIAGSEELKKYIESILNGKEPNERESIGETTSTAYVDSDNAISNNNTGSFSGDLGNTGAVAQQTSAANTANDGAGSGDLDGFKSSDNNAKDVNDLATTLPKVGDKIAALNNLQDCSTGGVANLRMDGVFTPPILPGYDGYDAEFSDGDPRESNFVAGTWYSYAGVAATYSTSPYQSAAAYLPTFDSIDPPNAPHTVSSVAEWDPATDFLVDVTIARSTGSTFIINVNVNRTGCTVGVDSYCPAEAPISNWPSDDIHQLRWDGAQFKTSDLEPDADILPQFSSNNSKVSGCTSGGTSVSVQAGNNGGWIMNIESGANNGKSIVADANGNVVAITTDTTPYLPGS